MYVSVTCHSYTAKSVLLNAVLRIHSEGGRDYTETTSSSETKLMLVPKTAVPLMTTWGKLQEESAEQVRTLGCGRGKEGGRSSVMLKSRSAGVWRLLGLAWTENLTSGLTCTLRSRNSPEPVGLLFVKIPAYSQLSVQHLSYKPVRGRVCLRRRCLSVSGVYLGCDVVWRPTEGGGGDSIEDSLLTHPKVCQLTVAVSIQQYVVQL